MVKSCILTGWRNVAVMSSEFYDFRFIDNEIWQRVETLIFKIQQHYCRQRGVLFVPCLVWKGKDKVHSTAGFKTNRRSYKIFIHDCKDEKISAAAVTVTHGGGGATRWRTQRRSSFTFQRFVSLQMLFDEFITRGREASVSRWWNKRRQNV